MPDSDLIPNKALLNMLSLAYAPLCNYDFVTVKKDKDIQKALSGSAIYMITQRQEILFTNIKFNRPDYSISFEIRKKGEDNCLICTFPLDQEPLQVEKKDCLLFECGSYLPDENYSTDYANGFKFYKNDYTEENFLLWLTPEKLLHLYYNEFLNILIEGDIRPFLEYKVHYVGQSTDQDIWKRLTGHSTLQDVLSSEYPLKSFSLPTHEICILFFEFQDNISMQNINPQSTENEIYKSLTCNPIPEKRTIYLDAEKGLIKAMKPQYNKVLFNRYPISEDGLFSHNYDSISYTISDPITLKYEYGDIRGGLNLIGGDVISVTDNSKFELIKVNI